MFTPDPLWKYYQWWQPAIPRGIYTGQEGEYFWSHKTKITSYPGTGFPWGEKTLYQSQFYEDGAEGEHLVIGRLEEEIVLVRQEGPDGRLSSHYEDDYGYNTAPMIDRKEDVISEEVWNNYTCWKDSRGRESRWVLVRPESRRLPDFPWQQMISYAVNGFRGKVIAAHELRRYFREWICQDAVLRRFLDPLDYYKSYGKWLKAEAEPNAWFADCFNAAMRTKHLKERLRDHLPVGNFEYVVLLEYLGVTPDKLVRDACRWGDLGEITMGRSFGEDRLEFAHSVWLFWQRTPVKREAARRSSLYTNGQREKAFMPSNWDELLSMGSDDDYDGLSPELLQEINGRAAILPPHLRMTEPNPITKAHTHRPTMYGPPFGTLVRASRWCDRDELRDLDGHPVRRNDLKGRVVGWDEGSKSFLVHYHSARIREDGTSSTKVPMLPEEMEEIIVEYNVPRAVWPTLVDFGGKLALVRAESDDERTLEPIPPTEGPAAIADWDSPPGPPSHPPPSESTEAPQVLYQPAERPGPPMKAPPMGATGRDTAWTTAAG